MNEPAYYLTRNTITGLYFDGYGHNEANPRKARQLGHVSALIVKTSFTNTELVPVWREKAAAKSFAACHGDRDAIERFA